jgi:REP element-mobilizing transposase RayT
MNRVIAYHLVFGTYGFWLPNDPRGSWSRYVGSRELLQFGPATKVNTPESRAHIEHDVEKRLDAKKNLKRPPVVFDGYQARAVGTGFAKAIEERKYRVLACSILPEHVHLVVANSSWKSRDMIQHLKCRATQQLKREGRWPQNEDSPWARFGWTVYITGDEQLKNAIQYVEQNPIRDGKLLQTWSFVEKLKY